MTENTTVTLSKPIKTHDGELSTLMLREPTARCFLEYGEPFKTKVGTDASGKDTLDFEYDYKVFGKFLVDMLGGKIDDLLLGTIRAVDFYILRNKATQLILGIAGANPTEPSAAA